MALSDEDIKTLLALRSESPNLDYKKGFIWNDKDKRDERLEIVKDILSVSNTKDGGKIIFGVEDASFKFEGLLREEFESFGPTDLANLLHEYSDPKIEFQLFKKEIDGKLIVVIDIPEFSDVPIFCKKDAHSQRNPSKQILKKGEIYIRTPRCSSEAVSSAQEMRELLGRALTKKGDELLRNIERLIRGKPREVVESDKDFYMKEIEQGRGFLGEHLQSSMAENGYWELIAYPVDYDGDRIADLMTVGKCVSDSQVVLRGWYFPHIDRDNLSNFGKGKQSFTIWERFIEGWRFYQSGLFIWRRAFWEDVEGRKDNGKPILSFINAIYSITEFLLFLKRLYADSLQVPDIYLSIGLNRCNERKLVALDALVAFWGSDISREDVICVEEVLKVVDLQAEYKEIAAKYIKRVFQIFNWEDVSDEVIDGWQRKLLERKI